MPLIFPLLLRFTEDQCFCWIAGLELNHSGILYNNPGQRDYGSVYLNKNKLTEFVTPLGFGTVENQSPKGGK